MQSGHEDTLKEWYAIKFYFKIRKNATETDGMLQTAFQPSSMNRASVFEWYKRFKEGRESVRDDERCGTSKEVNTPELIGQRVRVRLLCWGFKGVQEEIPWEEASTLQIGSVAFPPGQCTSPQLHPCHTLFDQDGHQDSSSASLLSRPCSLWLFGYSLSSEAVVMRQLRRWKRLWRRSLTRSHKRTSMGPSRTVQQVHCIRRRLLRRGLEFHVCSINKSTPTKKVWKLIVCTSYNINFTDRIWLNIWICIHSSENNFCPFLPLSLIIFIIDGLNQNYCANKNLFNLFFT